MFDYCKDYLKLQELINIVKSAIELRRRYGVAHGLHDAGLSTYSALAIAGYQVLTLALPLEADRRERVVAEARRWSIEFSKKGMDLQTFSSPHLDLSHLEGNPENVEAATRYHLDNREITLRDFRSLEELLERLEQRQASASAS